MIQPSARSKSFSRIISGLDEIIEKNADYFDDEQTAQLNITTAWLNDALITVRQHELQRLKLATKYAIAENLFRGSAVKIFA